MWRVNVCDTERDSGGETVAREDAGDTRGGVDEALRRRRELRRPSDARCCRRLPASTNASLRGRSSASTALA